MVWLLRHEPRWLVDHLVRQGLLAPDLHIEVLPPEVWPVGEEDRNRQISADVVLRLWRTPPPESPNLELIHAQVVIGLIIDFQNRIDPRKQIRVIEYQWAYPPVLGLNIFVVFMTFDSRVARWALEILDRLHPTVHRSVITPDTIARSESIDPDKAPRRALLEAMCFVRDRADLGLLKHALRAVEKFSGNEMLIYRHMLLSRIGTRLIMEADDQLDQLELDELELDDDDDELDDDDEFDDDDELQDWEMRFLAPFERRAIKRGRKQGREEGREEGKLLGRAHALLDLLRDRGFEPDPAVQARIVECTDQEQLRRWFLRAATLDRLDALFED